MLPVFLCFCFVKKTKKVIFVKVPSVSCDVVMSLLLSPSSAIKEIWLDRHILWLKCLIPKETSARALHLQETSMTHHHQEPSLPGEELSSRRMMGHHDSNHRRKGEEVRRRNIDINEQEPNDKKTTMTTSTMTSSIHHILACATSHGSRATMTCLWGIDDITSIILDYLVSSHSSSNGQQQLIYNKQRRGETDINNIKQSPWLNIKDLQHLHTKVQQQSSIKHNMVGDNNCSHHIHTNTGMLDVSDAALSSSELITLSEAKIMSADINMLTVSQPRLPTPTPFDGTSPPFQEWASELRAFLDINGFQYIIQMDIAFREDAPIQLHHLCSGTEPGTTAQDGITATKAGIKALQEELDEPTHLRDDADINRDIGILEADIIVHQANFDDELAKVKKASDYLNYILVHSTKTGSEPNHYIRRLHQSENGFEAWRLLRLRYSGGHRLGTYSLLQNILAPRWTEQHQHHQLRVWMEDIARYESESGLVINDHLKIATVMNHLRFHP